MQLNLNIYENRNVVKSYTAESYDIMFGTVEDLLNLVDLSELKEENEIEFLNFLIKFVSKGFGVIKPLLKDIFDGLTDEELKNTKIKEVAVVLKNLIEFTILQISNNSQKN